MRLFYDQYSSRERADLLLLAADSLTTVSAVLFASGAPYRAEAGWDVLLLALWALIPRSVARFLASLARPQDFFHSLTFSMLLVLFMATLIVSGWEVLWRAAPAHLPLRPETAITVMLTWACGFLLCYPRSYRLHDFLAGATVLLGLMERKPQPFIWLSFFLLGLCLSAASRHLLHDVFTGALKPRFNLQNARALALLTTLLAAGSFAGIAAGLYPLLDARLPDTAWGGGRFNWYSPRHAEVEGGAGTVFTLPADS
jgi:hypothetical protein